METISYSSLKLAKDCPACFWWQVKKRIRRLNSWQSNLPNVVEKFILDRFEIYRNLQKLPSELNIPELKNFKLIDSQTHNKWKDIFSGEPSYEDLTANPDDVLTNGKEWIVIDIKTIGKYPENCTRENMLEDIDKFGYQLQLEFYSYILRNSGFPTPNYGYILFYFMDKGENEGELKLKSEVIRVELDFNEIKELIKEAREILKLEKAPNIRCKFCSSHQQRYDDLLKEQKEQEELISKFIDL